MANVQVQVNSLESDPEKSTDSPLMPGSGELRTDSTGSVTFTVKHAGRYMAQGTRGDTVLVLDTLNASKPDTLVFKASSVVKLQGKIRLYSGYRVDTGVVFLRGSSLLARVSHEGDFDLGYVPVSAAKLTVGTRYSARPASRVFVRMADAGSALVLDSRFTLDSSLAPSNGSNLTLLKAAQSETNICLDNGRGPVQPGISIKGSTDNTNDVMRAASFACSDRTGAQIQVDKSSLSGQPVEKLGVYVQPDPSVWPLEYKIAHGLSWKSVGQTTVVPSACLSSGSTTNFTAAVNSDSTGVQIRVDDIGFASGCSY